MSSSGKGHQQRMAGMRNGGSGLGPASQIGSRLRALYRSVEEEPVPDRFLDLLEQLDRAEMRSRPGKGEADE